jgi:hypothetical protein
MRSRRIFHNPQNGRLVRTAAESGRGPVRKRFGVLSILRRPTLSMPAPRPLFSSSPMKDIDPTAHWERLVASQPAPTRELFDSLFQAGDRDKIICACIPQIRRFNKRTPKAIREDVEFYAIGEVTKEVDRLLQHPNANPGSYLIDCIKHSIHAARFGVSKEARDCVSSNKRLYRPRKRKSDDKRDALIAKLELAGFSESMIETELSSRGWDRPRIVENESAWPSEKVRGSDAHFTGERIAAEFGVPQPAVDDRWELLSEVCDESEMLMLELLSHGYDRTYVAEELGVHESTITNRVAAIRAKVQRQRERDGEL